MDPPRYTPWKESSSEDSTSLEREDDHAADMQPASGSSGKSDEAAASGPYEKWGESAASAGPYEQQGKSAAAPGRYEKWENSAASGRYEKWEPSAASGPYEKWGESSAASSPYEKWGDSAETDKQRIQSSPASARKEGKDEREKSTAIPKERKLVMRESSLAKLERWKAKTSHESLKETKLNAAEKPGKRAKKKKKISKRDKKPSISWTAPKSKAPAGMRTSRGPSCSGSTTIGGKCQCCCCCGCHPCPCEIKVRKGKEEFFESAQSIETECNQEVITVGAFMYAAGTLLMKNIDGDDKSERA